MGLLEIIKKQRPATSGKQTLSPINIDTWTSRTAPIDLLKQDAIVSCIDAIAKNVAKAELKAVITRDGKTTTDERSDVARVLRNPNKYMTAYDFLYKITSLLLAYNNVFIWPEYDDFGNLRALWPINYTAVKIVKGPDSELYCRFQLSYFKEYTIPYAEVIHLRNHFIRDDIFGDEIDPLNPVAEVLKTQNNGIINAIRNSAIIRGILKSVNVLKESTIKQAREDFIRDNLNASNNGGIMVIDGKFDYKQIDSKPFVIDAETLSQIKGKIYDYFHVSEKFVQSRYTDDEYEAVYESVIEPTVIAITQAFTKSLFTDRERGFGNRIDASTASVKYQAMKTVVSIIGTTCQLGLFTRDEYREMLGYSPLGTERGGDDIMVAANNYTAETKEPGTTNMEE